VALNVKNRTLFTGDNLDVMRGINAGSADLIYLDPPFNSNRDYAAPIGSEAAGAAFKDTWTLSDVDIAWIGLIADREPALARIIESAGLAHGKGMQAYLTMMAVRLVEMRRLLKAGGSLYLHCDSTASHYLKLVMDCVFGAPWFRSELTWKRTNAKGLARSNYPANADTILYYARDRDCAWNPQFRPLGRDYVESHYTKVEPETGRRYRLDNLLNPNRDRPNLTYEFMGVTRVWRWTQERMQAAQEKGLIVQTKPGGTPQLKRYLDESKGTQIDTVWDDIPAVNSQAKERVGYPTQKPLALLERIIKASSNEGDVVLDPFCGCATALVAAETLNRQWVGIDLSSLAVQLVVSRLQKAADAGALLDSGRLPDVHHRTDIPRRTDVGELPPYKTHRHTLYGKQEGNGAGCGIHFPFRNLTVDHIVPKSRGGTDHLDNLQLLCGACNSMKGAISQAAFHAKLTKQGLR
jgi:site-specific DNA-methyltransferase (adenine-specific)